jgi:RimJ/RimL family protein N-acetyltransferase
MSVIEPAQHILKDERAVTIRSADVNDASGLLESAMSIMANNDFAPSQPDEWSVSLEDEVKLVEQHRQDQGKLWLVAEHRGVIIGSLIFSTGQFRRVAHRGTLGMGLDRAWRGQGLGSLLMQCLLDWAENEPSVEKVGLTVFSTNTAAIRLYKKFGFVEEGRRPREVKMGPGQYVDDILMYRLVKR